jgi:hypothetical protein
MNKNLVHQFGDQTKVLLRCMVNQPSRCTNFSNLFLESNLTCFGQFLCPSSGVIHCTHSNGICHTVLLSACQQDQEGTQFHPDIARITNLRNYCI